MNKKWAAQRAQCGRAKAKRGRKTEVCPPVALVKAMCATMRCTSSGCMGLVTRSLFSCRIESWQRYMALAMLCQEMHGPCSCSATERPFVTARKGFLSLWTGCDENGEGCGERCEGEGTCAASPFELCWLASFFRIFGGGHGVLVERGFSFLSLGHRVALVTLCMRLEVGVELF